MSHPTNGESIQLSVTAERFNLRSIHEIDKRLSEVEDRITEIENTLLELIREKMRLQAFKIAGQVFPFIPKAYAPQDSST